MITFHIYRLVPIQFQLRKLWHHHCLLVPCLYAHIIILLTVALLLRQTALNKNLS